jgi:hypothetical protein
MRLSSNHDHHHQQQQQQQRQGIINSILRLGLSIVYFWLRFLLHVGVCSQSESRMCLSLLVKNMSDARLPSGGETWGKATTWETQA